MSEARREHQEEESGADAQLTCSCGGSFSNHREGCPLRTGEFEQMLVPYEHATTTIESRSQDSALSAATLLAQQKEEALRLGVEIGKIEMRLGRRENDRISRWTEVLGKLSTELQHLEISLQGTRQYSDKYIDLEAKRERLLHYQTRVRVLLSKPEINIHEETELATEGMGLETNIDEIITDEIRLETLKEQRDSAKQIIDQLEPLVENYNFTTMLMESASAPVSIETAVIRDARLRTELEKAGSFFERIKELEDARKERLDGMKELSALVNRLNTTGEAIMKNELREVETPEERTELDARRRELRRERDEITEELKELQKKAIHKTVMPQKTQDIFPVSLYHGKSEDSVLAKIPFSIEEVRNLQTLDVETELCAGKIKDIVPKQTTLTAQNLATAAAFGGVSEAFNYSSGYYISVLQQNLQTHRRQSWFKECKRDAIAMGLVGEQEHLFTSTLDLVTKKERGIVAAALTTYLGSPAYDEVLKNIQKWGVNRDTRERKIIPPQRAREGRTDGFLRVLEEKLFTKEELGAIHIAGLAEYTSSASMTPEGMRERLVYIAPYIENGPLFEELKKLIESRIEDNIARGDYFNAAIIETYVGIDYKLSPWTKNKKHEEKMSVAREIKAYMMRFDKNNVFEVTAEGWLNIAEVAHDRGKFIIPRAIIEARKYIDKAQALEQTYSFSILKKFTQQNLRIRLIKGAHFAGMDATSDIASARESITKLKEEERVYELLTLAETEGDINEDPSVTLFLAKEVVNHTAESYGKRLDGSPFERATIIAKKKMDLLLVVAQTEKRLDRLTDCLTTLSEAGKYAEETGSVYSVLDLAEEVFAMNLNPEDIMRHAFYLAETHASEETQLYMYKMTLEKMRRFGIDTFPVLNKILILEQSIAQSKRSSTDEPQGASQEMLH